GDLSNNFWRGGQRKRIQMLDNARQLARAPHALTWIEYSYAEHYLERIKELKGQGIGGLHGQTPLRMGWLICQHPHNDAGFMSCEIRSSVNDPERVFVHPLGQAWCTDDSPSPWRRFPPPDLLELVANEGGSISEAIVDMPDYRSTQVHWHAFFGDRFTIEMLN